MSVAYSGGKTSNQVSAWEMHAVTTVAYCSIAATLSSHPGNTKGGSITVPLTSCLTGLNESVLQIKTKIVSCHIANSKPVKQEVNGTVILPPLVFPVSALFFKCSCCPYVYAVEDPYFAYWEGLCSSSLR
jgi:hypothetical protein